MDAYVEVYYKSCASRSFCCNIWRCIYYTNFNLCISRKQRKHLTDILTGDKAEEFLQNAINSENDEKKYKAVREFSTDFEALINKSKQGRIVILIDDLDRCLPRHIIDNLEAIKLFLNVPKTAFVIAADQYIVSNAIKSEYKTLIEASKEDRHHDNLGEAYMEKSLYNYLPTSCLNLVQKKLRHM